MPMGPWKVRQMSENHTLRAEVWIVFSAALGLTLPVFTDHCVRPAALPRQAYGVHCQLPEHHGVWDGEHPFSESRVWSVSNHKYSPQSCNGWWKFHFFAISLESWSLFLCSWVGYEHSSFCGQQFVLEKGDYPCIEAYSGSNSYRIERMISFRPVCCAVGLNVLQGHKIRTGWHSKPIFSSSFCTEPQGVSHDHLREGEHDGSSVWAVWRLSVSAGYGLGEQRGRIHAHSQRSVSLSVTNIHNFKSLQSSLSTLLFRGDFKHGWR